MGKGRTVWRKVEMRSVEVKGEVWRREQKVEKEWYGRLRTGPWRTAIFKERGGNHKPTKKTKKDKSKIRRDVRRG